MIGLKLHLSIRDLIGESMKLYDSKDPSALASEVEHFFQSRVRSIFGEMGFSHDEIEASLAGALDDVYEAYRRVQALHELRGNDEFRALLISFKRMSNIISEEDRTHSFTESLLREEEERALYDALKEAAGEDFDYPTFEGLELEITPEAAEAARFLVELLLEE